MSSVDVTPKKTICLLSVEVIVGVSTFWLQQFQVGWGAKFGPEGSSIIGSPSGNPE